MTFRCPNRVLAIQHAPLLVFVVVWAFTAAAQNPTANGLMINGPDELRGRAATVGTYMPTLLRREAGAVTVKPEQSKVSAYFNVDNGTGKIRGVYLQENESVAPIFEAWMKPFKDLGMTTLTMRTTGGTDHLSFDAAGIPGFQFIQDPVEYETRTHHSNMDVYDRLQAEDLKQAAVIVASFVYNAAMRDEKLPRKPIEKPLQKEPQ